MVNITHTKDAARELTRVTEASAGWGEQIERLHQQFLQSGADSLRHALDAGDRLQAAFDHPDRRSLFPRWSDWLAQFAPHISPRTDNYYRELASKRAEVEAYIQQVLAGNESATLRGAIAYLAESKERTKTADMPPWVEFAKLLDQVGRVRKVQGDRLLLEPPAWAERHVTGLPKVYASLGDLWQAWKENGEQWAQQVEEARAIAESQIGGPMPSQGRDTSPDDETLTAPPQGTPTGQDDGDPGTFAAMVDCAGQAIAIGSEVIYRLDDGDEIGTVMDFDDCSLVVSWPLEGECHHPPEALLVCSDSQPVANESSAITPEVVTDGSDRFYRMNSTGGNGERNTPERYWRPALEMANAEAFDLDPMTNANSSVPARVKFTEAENGLVQSWNVNDGKPVLMFSNPDFGLNGEFVDKLAQEVEKGYALEAVIFNKLDSRVEWCQRLLSLSACICLVTEYVTFEGLDKHGQALIQSPFSLAYYYIGSRSATFAQAHQHLGLIFSEMTPPF